MCNCNQQRAAYTAQLQTQPPQKGVVKVKLTGNKPIVISGNFTGRTYAFRKTNDMNLVDSRDMISMKEMDGLQVMY